MKFDAEVNRVVVAESGVIEVRFEVRGDKEFGISGNGVLRMKEGLAVQVGQRLTLDVEAGPMVRRGTGQKGRMDLSGSLPKAVGRAKQKENSNG